MDPRFDSGEQSSKIATSLIRSVPLQSDYSPALQIEGGLIQKGQMPLLGMLGQGSRNYETHHSAKVTITVSARALSLAKPCRPPTTNGCVALGPSRRSSRGGTISIDIGETAQILNEDVSSSGGHSVRQEADLAIAFGG
ncbi:hypothetical protein QA645_40680 [Bradyrhizobium sp. CIAT3101]|uniref:hypothetical protein n=1 Tax=Bradyrhizobium sp. CIAT3101 TaxID=439387 RepID=UPI0024B062AF|nr:hypothetical protein [Bradyrhizobium sp. CIAT3101]WFU80675.1 hypothetical protein QA645_40680 [Bradyrhizobium sp. CIAT3101]